MDVIAALVLGGILSLGLIVKYQPQLNKLKKSREKMFSDFQEYFNTLSSEEKESFFGSLNDSEKNAFQYALADSSFHDDFQQQMFMQQVDQFNNWAMSESLKSVTPFDHGGYVMGPGFNPSDTMAFESHQMDMNNSMNDFNNNSFNDNSSMNNF